MESDIIDDRTFRAFARMIYDKCGIVITEKKRALLQARLSKRMRKVGISTFKEYLKVVENDQQGTELVELLDAISTNVTHFFREVRHFEFLHQELERLERKGQSRFRIWCAAASTGEEPYSLAITMQEALHYSGDAKILATDISTDVLRKAKSGRYLDEKVKTVPPAQLHRYFTKSKEGTKTWYQAIPALQSMIRFGRLNLIHVPYSLRGPLDFIFCRNVMIYFDNPVRQRIIAEFMRLLKPGGYLVVGHAESLTATLTDQVIGVSPAVYRRK
jgi:chemotaxis protein methyltransferase CheR